MKKIHVFVRHCWATNSKARPPWFDKQACLRRLLDTCTDDCRVTVVFDGDAQGHFVETVPGVAEIVEVEGAGSDARSFLGTLAAVLRACEAGTVADEDIVYLTEDDYWHAPGWCEALREGLDVFEYVSPYDHPDKYTATAAAGQSQAAAAGVMSRVPAVHVTRSTHWRTACSTTNTYAALAGTLRADMDVHRQYCQQWPGQRVTTDHEKFLDLWTRGRTLGTCLPARATHCEPECLAPVVDWARQAAATSDALPGPVAAPP